MSALYKDTDDISLNSSKITNASDKNCRGKTNVLCPVIPPPRSPEKSVVYEIMWKKKFRATQDAMTQKRCDLHTG
jgi:hypothetical protein